MSSSITTAVSHDSLHIPLIDFSTFLSPTTSAETKLATARAILEGFQNAGFIYLRNHGIPKPVVQKTFQQSAEFFKRPLSQKDALAWTTPEANRGYVAQGREKVTDATDAEEIEQLRAAEGEDLKESLEIGREGEEGLPNHWPEKDGEEFKASMLDFFDKCKDLHVNVMRAIAVGLGIEEGWFDSYCDKGDNTLRYIPPHYHRINIMCLLDHNMQTPALPSLPNQRIQAKRASSSRRRPYRLRQHHAALPRHGRRPASALTQRKLRQRHTNRRHDCRQRRGSPHAVVERYHKKHQAPRRRAPETGGERLAPEQIQYCVLLQSELVRRSGFSCWPRQFC
jgi:hypothetical protein